MSYGFLCQIEIKLIIIIIIIIIIEDCVQVKAHNLEKCLCISKVKILREVSRSRIIENNKYGRSKEGINKKH